jgi:hypothetical protein
MSCTGASTNTTSAAILQTDYAASSHTTCFAVTTPGAITLTPTASAGTVSGSYTFTVAGFFDVTSTATPSSKATSARVEWDGTNLIVRGWQASP